MPTTATTGPQRASEALADVSRMAGRQYRWGLRSAPMLGFERRFVGALTTTPDPGIRGEVETWVEGSLRAMPQHLRLGVAGETVLLSAWAALSRTDAAALAAALDRSPVALLRQYVRLFRSLVLFAEQELAPAA